MVESGCGARLALKSLAQFGPVGKMRGLHLDGDDAVQPRVSRAVHLAHPASANRASDLIWSEFGTWSGRHKWP
jgi:hypothetical protein